VQIRGVEDGQCHRRRGNGERATDRGQGTAAKETNMDVGVPRAARVNHACEGRSMQRILCKKDD
jgi:hypothetical protein